MCERNTAFVWQQLVQRWLGVVLDSSVTGICVLSALCAAAAHAAVAQLMVSDHATMVWVAEAWTEAARVAEAMA